MKDNQGDIDHGNGYFKPIPGCYTLTKISDTAYTLTPSVAEYAKQYDIQKSLPEGTHTNTTAQSKVGTFTLTWENNKWNADKTSVTIGVKCTAPDEPGIEVLNSLIQVKVKDFAGSNVPVGAIDHSDRVYGLLENTYKAGAIIPNQNEKTYTAALTLTEGQPYAGKFDESHSLPSGTHSVTTSVSKLPTLTLTYNSANQSWTANSTGWTIGVKCQPAEGPDDPSIPTPTDADISGLGLKVTVQCVSESVTHDRDGVITNNSITYNVIADETKERYTIGNVTGTSCTVTILPGVYVGRFDTSARETHRLTEDTQERGIPIGLVYENGAWKLASGETETVTFNVTCVPEKPADDQIPTIVDPDPSDNVKAQIRVQCVYDANTHKLDTKDYDLWPNTSDITRYEVSEPVKSGDGAWTCTVTFSDEVYVGRYNQEDEIVSAHKLVDESAPIILTWDPETQTWNAPEYLTNPVATFSVTCVPEQPPETTYTLIYDANGGTFADGSKVMEETGLPAGEHTLSDAAPTYGAYIFSGWTLDSSAQNVIYTDGQLPATVTAVTIIQENITVYAVWRESPSVDPVTYHTVTFVNLGSTYATQRVADGHTATQPASPTRSGYTFAGWYLGSSRYNFSAPVTADIELTAHWTEDSGGSNPGSGEDNDCILRFDSNGGTEFDEIDNGDDPFTINPYVDHIPSRSGYRFTGWYRRSDLTNRIEGDLRVTSVVTIYAGWEETSVPSMLNGDDHYAYIQGYADGTVRPDANITRAQVATIFFRLLDEDVRDDNLTTYNTFPDVDQDYWANTAISTMAALGVINGRNNGNFDPNAYITRAEFAAICARFDESGVTGITTYTDTNGHWAEDEISRAAALGWIQGYADGSFRPNQYITRAQAVTMINRVLCRLPEDEDDLLSGMNTWTDCRESDWFYLAIQEATNSHGFVTKDRVYESWTDLNRAPDWSWYE